MQHSTEGLVLVATVLPHEVCSVRVRFSIPAETDWHVWVEPDTFQFLGAAHWMFKLNNGWSNRSQATRGIKVANEIQMSVETESRRQWNTSLTIQSPPTLPAKRPSFRKRKRITSGELFKGYFRGLTTASKADTDTQDDTFICWFTLRSKSSNYFQLDASE